MKENCWEVRQCGREPDGKKAEELGICPASIAEEVNGTNGGKNGGRACWAIEKTLCGGKVQGTFTQKLCGCLKCEFYASVRKEEKDSYTGTSEILVKLRVLNSSGQKRQPGPFQSEQRL